MPIHLPNPVHDYVVSGNSDDVEALATCFTSGAIVRDEGRTYEGLEAIKAWHANARDKYHHTVEPLDIVQRNDKIVMTARVSGNFPNSPVTLEHTFQLMGGKIAALEIR
jgi:hypothetical protein